MDTQPETKPYAKTISYYETEQGKQVKITVPIPSDQTWIYHMLDEQVMILRGIRTAAWIVAAFIILSLVVAILHP